MIHPEIEQFMVEDRIETLRRDARRVVRTTAQAAPEDLSRIELRLCRVDDDPALELLAALEERDVPAGRFVIAELDGRVVAALPIAGGRALTDPFVRTTHIRRLLELRAEQVRLPAERRQGFFPAPPH